MECNHVFVVNAPLRVSGHDNPLMDEIMHLKTNGWNPKNGACWKMGISVNSNSVFFVQVPAVFVFWGCMQII